MEDEELKFGPNGGLVFCLEFLLENISWLEEALDSGEQAEIVFNLVFGRRFIEDRSVSRPKIQLAPSIGGFLGLLLCYLTLS